MMKDLEKYRQYFRMIDDRTPFSLFKKHVFELIELAEGQHPLKKSYGESPEDLPSLKAEALHQYIRGRSGNSKTVRIKSLGVKSLKHCGICHEKTHKEFCWRCSERAGRIKRAINKKLMEKEQTHDHITSRCVEPMVAAVRDYHL